MGASELDRTGPSARSSGCGCPAATQEADHRGRDRAAPPNGPALQGSSRTGLRTEAP